MDQFDTFRDKCQDVDGFELVQYATQLQEQGCVIDLSQHRRAQAGSFIGGGATEQCTWDDLDDAAAELDYACCGPEGMDCRDGNPPTTCSPSCSVAANTFANRCGDTLDSIFEPTDTRVQTFMAFTSRCIESVDTAFFMNAIENAICPEGNCMPAHPTYNPDSLVFDINALDWVDDTANWRSRVGDIATAAMGGDIIKEVHEGTWSVRLDSSDDKFTFPLDIGPSNFPVMTLEIWFYLDNQEATFGWLFGAENGGCDRFVILHDSRIGGAGPSCKNIGMPSWGLGNAPVGQWSHFAAVYNQGGEEYAVGGRFPVRYTRPIYMCRSLQGNGWPVSQRREEPCPKPCISRWHRGSAAARRAICIGASRKCSRRVRTCLQ